MPARPFAGCLIFLADTTLPTTWVGERDLLLTSPKTSLLVHPVLATQLLDQGLINVFDDLLGCDLGAVTTHRNQEPAEARG